MPLRRFASMRKLNRYLIEISIIIIGITISFGVQSHLKEREDNRKQVLAYERIFEDLKQDREYFSLAFENNEQQIKAAKSIVNGPLNQTNFNRIIPYYGTFFNDNTITSIMSTGLLEDFENRALINEILTYYRQDYDFLADAVRFDEEIALQNLLLIAKEAAIDSVSTTSILRHQNESKTPIYSFGDSTAHGLTNNQNFVGLLQAKIWIKMHYNNFVENALKRNLSISEGIQKELKALR